MRSLPEFFKTTLLGGLFVLLPLILLYLLLAEMLQLVVVLATPLADLFPAGTFDRINAPVLIAVLLIVGASFIFGLALRSMSLRRFGGWIERMSARPHHVGSAYGRENAEWILARFREWGWDAQIETFEQDATFGRFVKAAEQIDERRLTTTRGSH